MHESHSFKAVRARARRSDEAAYPRSRGGITPSRWYQLKVLYQARRPASSKAFVKETLRHTHLYNLNK